MGLGWPIPSGAESARGRMRVLGTAEAGIQAYSTPSGRGPPWFGLEIVKYASAGHAELLIGLYVMSYCRVPCSGRHL